MKYRMVAPILVGLLAVAGPILGHSGPPFPILSDKTVGAYAVSIWTDPDVTDDATPAGKFWVIVHSAAGAEPPAATRVYVAVRPLDRAGVTQRGTATPQPGAASRYFASLLMDHEGSWEALVTLEGPLGSVSVSAGVEATYDLRPPATVLPFLVLPFVLVGLLWLKAIRTRRRARRGETRQVAPGGYRR